MSRYLTPLLARVTGSGLPLATVSDPDLAGMIARAEADIDAFMEFREDQGLGFALGTRGPERQGWNPVQRRVYPFCFPVPVRSVTSFQIQVSQSSTDGTPIAATVPPNMVIVNNDLGYLEPISLSVIAFGLTPVIAQLSLVQPFSLVTYLAGYAIAKAGYRLFSADLLTYHSFLPAWDTAGQAPVVYAGGAVVGSGYSVDAFDGAVTFAAPRLPTDAITCDFTHTIPDIVTQAARMAFSDVAQEYFANLQPGMAGFDRVHVGNLDRARSNAGRDAAPPWQRLLAPLKRLNVAMG